MQPLYDAMFGGPQVWTMLYVNHVMKGQFYKGIIEKGPSYGHFSIIPL